MPPLPWTAVSAPDPDAECTVVATRLPLRSHRSIPGFVAWTLRIRRQLARSPGLVGYALDAHLLAKTFWTVSAWTGRDELGRFDRADPHRAATRAIRPAMLEPAFVSWTCAARDLPVRWDEVRRRVDAERSHATSGRH